jgi:Tfp pilus assembly protein PilW
MSTPSHLPKALADESGITLVELLVAMASGVLVMGALLGILIISQHQTAVLTDVAQATQAGRTTMTRIVDELHSSCISEGFAPVQSGSNNTKLVVVNAYSESAEIPVASTTRLDQIAFEGGKLVDTTTPASGGAWPTFTFKGAPIVTTLGTGISKSSTLTEGKTATIFNYYRYDKEPESSSSTGVSGSLEEMTVPVAGFSEAELKEISAVGVNFVATPRSGLEKVGRSATQSTINTFAFSIPNSEAKIADGPCT